MLYIFRRWCSLFVFKIETEYSSLSVDFLNCGPEISEMQSLH